MKFEIDSWRWAGVPFYARTGKALAASATEAVVELKEPPRMLFDEAGGPVPARNLVRLRLGKRDGVTFTLQAKTPGPHLDSQEVDISVDFAAALGDRRDAYERLLDDALDGNPRRFARQDVVEHTWRVVQPALDDPGPVHPYERGSWGPRKRTRSSTRTGAPGTRSRNEPPGPLCGPDHSGGVSGPLWWRCSRSRATTRRTS